MSKKDEMLRQLDDDELLELARSVSVSEVDSSTSRSVLTRVVRESFSLGEIKERVKLAKERPKEGELATDGLRLGGIGQLLLSVSAIITLVSYTLYFTSSFYFAAFDFSLQTFSLVEIVNSIIFLMFVALFSISAKRVTGTHGGSRAGTIGVATGFIAFTIVFSYHVFALLGMTTTRYYSNGEYYTGPNALGTILPVLYSIFLGLTLILIGIFFVAYRKRFLKTELWLLAGIVYAFAGAAEPWAAATSVYIVSDTAILAGILGALCFLTSRSLERRELVKLTRDELIPGAVGQGFFAASTALGIVAYPMASLTGIMNVDSYQILAPWGLASSVLFLIFGLLLGGSMASVAPKLGGNNLGKSSALLAVIAAFAGMLYYGLIILGVAITIPFIGTSSLNELGFAMLVAYRVLVGATMILLGAFLLLNHEHASSSELWMVCGLIFMVIGSDQFSILSFLYIPFPLLVAGFIGAACFLAGKVAE